MGQFHRHARKRVCSTVRAISILVDKGCAQDLTSEPKGKEGPQYDGTKGKRRLSQVCGFLRAILIR
jgi:hypothetical protein